MAKKIIGVENLNVIRDFVLSKILTESDDIKRILTEEQASFLAAQLEIASKSITDKYDAEVRRLEERIDLATDAEELEHMRNRLEALNDDYDEQNKTLSDLSEIVSGIRDTELTPGNLYQLITSAMTDRTEITEDLFVDNLETVTIVSDDETQELHHCKLIQIAHYEDGWYFIIDEMTQAEIDKDNTEAQTFYTAMMTDTLMEA